MKKPPEKANPYRLTSNELLAERDRLTELIERGEGTTHDASRLRKVRKCLAEIEAAKSGPLE